MITYVMAITLGVLVTYAALVVISSYCSPDWP